VNYFHNSNYFSYLLIGKINDKVACIIIIVFINLFCPRNNFFYYRQLGEIIYSITITNRLLSKKQHPLFPLQVQTRKAFAEHLGFSYDTLRRRIKEKNITLSKGKMLTPKEQRMLLKALGYDNLLRKYDTF
jgi:hypothetical protein